MEQEAQAPVAPEVAEVDPEPVRVVQDQQNEIPNAPEEEAEVNLEEDVPDLVDVPDDDSDSDDEEEENEEPAQAEGIATRTQRRTGTQINPPNRYTMVSVKVNKKRETGERKIALDKADKDELELLFVQLRGLLPVFWNN